MAAAWKCKVSECNLGVGCVVDVPFLLRPLFFLFLTILTDLRSVKFSRWLRRGARNFAKSIWPTKRLACNRLPHQLLIDRKRKGAAKGKPTEKP